jgi:hypothetical protein
MLRLINCTLAANRAANGKDLGCDSYEQQSPSSAEVTNCIFWSGERGIWNNDNSAIAITYSDVQGGSSGLGNIDADPCFAQPGCWADVNDPNLALEPNDVNAAWFDGDYHLKSQSGRWDPNSESWVVDDVTSGCIDGGDPASDVTEEPLPNGGIVNMGVCGGTEQASKTYPPTCWEASECAGQQYGDANCDGAVAFIDLGMTKFAFFSTKGDDNYLCCADFNHDDKINFLDLGIIKVNYFTTGHSPSTGNQDCPP